MKRYNKFVFEAEEGINFEFSEGANGELFIKVVNRVDTEIGDENVQTKNYKNPIIPKGYKYICGEWNNGFVIERYLDGSQFVWVPVGSLRANGTLDGNSFNRKFGRRNYLGEKFSELEYHEDMELELELQYESIQKYGGFYISRYNISCNKIGMTQSIKGAMPRINISFSLAKRLANSVENNNEVKSHLPYGAEYDSILEWLIESKARTKNEIIVDSTEWGNYWNSKKTRKIIEKTGKDIKWSINNIFDLAGNVSEWTQEKKGDQVYVVRGGSYEKYGDIKPVSSRSYVDDVDNAFYSGFRAALYIK